MASAKAGLAGRYLFRPEGGTTIYDIGYITEASSTVSPEVQKLKVYDSKGGRNAETTVSSVEESWSVTTANLSKENVALLFGGEITSKTVAIGEELPDFTLATEETTFEIFKHFDKKQVIGALAVVEDNAQGRNDTHRFDKVSIRLEGDMQRAGDDWANMSLVFEVLVDANGDTGYTVIGAE